MKEFIHKYTNDTGFKDFIDNINDKEVLMEFAYRVFIKYGMKIHNKVTVIFNDNIFDIDRVIKYYENSDNYERCEQLMKIKNNGRIN